MVLVLLFCIFGSDNMPYISQEVRFDLLRRHPITPGELSYKFTNEIKTYWNQGTFAGNKQDYQRINDILGALEGAKLEFVRRVVNPYEDSKIKDNGDVYS